MKNRNLEVTVDGKDPVVREKVVKLLKKYNAALGFNADENMFQVDLEVQFNSTEEKDRFIRSYLSNKVKTAMHNKHRTILQERSKDQDNQNTTGSDIVQQLHRQKQLINETIRQQLSDTYHRQHFSTEPHSAHNIIHKHTHHNTNDTITHTHIPKSQQFKIHTVSCDKPEDTIRQQRNTQQEVSSHKSQKSSHKSSYVSSYKSSHKELSDAGIDYHLLDYKLQMTINNIFRMLSTHKYSSAHSRHSKSIKIVQQMEQEQDIIHDTAIKRYQESSPSTIQPASTERDHLSVIRDINYEIDKLEQQSLDLNRYTVNSVIEQENPSQLSVQSEADIRRKREHFRFLQNRMSMPKLNKTKKTTTPVPFDQNKFRQFIQIQKTRIDILFEQTKIKIRTPEKSRSRLKTPGLELWRQHLTDPRSTLHDPSETFSKKFYEAFEMRILAENKMLNSGQLVNYFKYLLQNARKMYVDFLQSKS